MTCTSCGAPTRVGAAYCGNCGAPVDAGTSAPVVQSIIPAVALPPPAAALLPPPPPPPPSPVQPPLAVPPVVSPAVAPVLPVEATAAPAARVVSGMIYVPSTITAPPGLIPRAEPYAAPTPMVTIPAPATVASALQVPTLDAVSAVDDATRIAPPRRTRATWRLVMPDGSEHALTSSIVVGRQPSDSVIAGVTNVLAFDDPEGLLSKSHAVFDLDGDDLWVRDLGSTNGVVVVGPGDAETTVSSTERTRLSDGAEIELGTYVVTARWGPTS